MGAAPVPPWTSCSLGLFLCDVLEQQALVFWVTGKEQDVFHVLTRFLFLLSSFLISPLFVKLTSPLPGKLLLLNISDTSWQSVRWPQ